MVSGVTGDILPLELIVPSQTIQSLKSAVVTVAPTTYAPKTVSLKQLGILSDELESATGQVFLEKKVITNNNLWKW